MLAATSAICSSAVRQELVQRRIEQADGHRQPRHDLEQLDEILRAASGSILASARAAAASLLGEDHLAHGEDAVALEEHMLGAAQPDAFGAEGARLARHRAACRHWRALSAGAQLSAHCIKVCEVAGQLGLAHRHAALDAPRRSSRRW